MAKEVLLPKQGNSVESCIIVEWSKSVGDAVATGDVLCQVETDKAVVDVESPADGVLLKTFFNVDDEVPVHTLIALLGDAGEDISSYGDGGSATTAAAPAAESAPAAAPAQAASPSPAAAPVVSASGEKTGAVSPRARSLAEGKGIDPAQIAGTGPGGRVIERDVAAALDGRQPLTPAAAAASAGQAVPASGTGIGGRVRMSDLGTGAAPAASPAQVSIGFPGPVTELPVKGIRKVISQRMHQSLSTTAQLTLNSSADATALMAMRKRLKNSPEGMGLTKITINDLILFAVSRTLTKHEEVNQHFSEEKMTRFANVHLGCAVDTPKGLMVPVVKFADCLSLKGISDEAKRLAGACQEGKAGPEDLSGGTFTVTNLGAMGIESFTPVLNTPEVGILGVCTITNQPVAVNGEIRLQPRIGLSLTFDHRALDGAPAARFLKDLAQTIENIDLALVG